MHSLSVATYLLSALSIASTSSIPPPVKQQTLQPLPLRSDDVWIVDANGARVPLVGINWPGAADAMIPEGLQYQSIASIVQRLVEMRFNVVRLTFAIEMVDDILDNGGDVKLRDALPKALGPENGTAVLEKIIAKNPQFNTNTTRLEVFDAVAAELAAQDIYLHLDNHVSKGKWCCNLTDGNAWFGDTYFDTDKWTRGLSYMAKYGRGRWPTFSSIGLRNELRPSLTFAPTLKKYSWSTWKPLMITAASGVHAANPDILIFFSGLEVGFNIEPEVAGSTLIDSQFSFHVADYEWAQKFVFEIHEYDIGVSYICSVYKRILLAFGWDATTKTGKGTNRGPLVLSEFGYDQSDASGKYNTPYATCLREFTAERGVGWMMWVLAGSMYIRDDTQDADEPYGLLDHTWSNYRGTESLAAIKKLVQETYSAYGQ